MGVKPWHFQGNLKQKTCDDLAKYVKRDERLPQVLLALLQMHRCAENQFFQVLYNLQKSGAKTFLLTNSGWEYTNQVLDLVENSINVVGGCFLHCSVSHVNLERASLL